LVLANTATPELARALQAMGYAALGTTSAGFAERTGLKDGQAGAEALLMHALEIADSVELPMSADLENGRAATLQAVSEYYRRAAAGGLAGASIEDAVTPDGDLFPLEIARDRLCAAIEGVRQISSDFVLTARTEVFLSPRPALAEAIRRLQAYEACGADVLFAPGLPLEALDTVLGAVRRPLNLLMSPEDATAFPGLFDRGVRRISLGAALARRGTAAAAVAAEILEAIR